MTDKQQFRPSSLWSRTFLPTSITNNPLILDRGLTILYVTENDSKYLNEIYTPGETVWITTRQKIPNPIWKCETECIHNPVIR